MTPARRQTLLERTEVQAVGAFLMALLMLALLPGTFAPTFFPNEDVYLPRLVQQTGQTPLRSDWTLAHLAPDRPLFEFVFTPLVRWTNPTVAVQIGRPLGWIALFGALLALLRGLGIKNPLAAAGLLLIWLVPFPYTVSQEWLFGAFESKTLAWAAVFAMLAAVGRNRVWTGALFTTLAIGLHFTLGVWGGLLFVGAVAASSVTPLARLGSITLAATLGALAGSPMLRYTLDNPAQAQSDIRGWTRGLWSIHHDPFQFPPLLLAGLAALCLGSFCLRLRAADTPVPTPWRVMQSAELVGAAAFFVGVVARMSNYDAVLLTMPFRVGPVIIALGAVVRAAQWTHSFKSSDRRASPRQLVGLAGLILVVAGHFGPPLHMREYRLDVLRWYFRPTMTDEQRAAKWSAQHLPVDAIVAINPAQAEFGLVDRRLVASLLTARTDALSDWNMRMASLSGQYVDRFSGTGFSAVRDAVAEGYDTRPFAVAETWPTQFGVTHIITRADYPLPVLAEFGPVSVYSARVGASSGA